MAIWEVKTINYYEVNDHQFNTESEAEDYALKLFLIQEINKLLDKAKSKDHVCILRDNKTLVYKEYHKPFVDTWNAGHYGCTGEPEDRSVYRKCEDLKEFVQYYQVSYYIGELYKIADNINIEQLSLVCDEETIQQMTLYKNMVDKLKTIKEKL